MSLAGGLDEAENGQRRHRFPAARFPDDAQRFAAPQLQADVIDRPHHAARNLERGREVLNTKEDGVAHPSSEAIVSRSGASARGGEARRESNKRRLAEYVTHDVRDFSDGRFRLDGRNDEKDEIRLSARGVSHVSIAARHCLASRVARTAATPSRCPRSMSGSTRKIGIEAPSSV